MIKETTTQDARSRGEWQGMNWIRQDKRLAIYLRDGMACAYCGASVESGAKLSLDHLTPHSKGGSNDETNLVTCCCRCNSARQTRSVASFARGVAAWLNVDTSEIVRHVRNCARRNLKRYRVEARQLIARRGSAARVLESGI